MPKNTLAIVGTHPDTREQAPWDNPNVDILVFNEAAAQTWVKRWNYCLQLHNKTIYRNPYNRTDPGHWAWLQKDHGAGKVIFMQERDPLVPNSKKFPRDEIRGNLLRGLTVSTPDGLVHPEPVTNSISFAFALGIHLGYKRIILYGAEMRSNTEYAYQRENFQFWLGVAVGRGVRVEMHSGQEMVSTAVYGYDGDLTYDPAAFERAAAENLKRQKAARKRVDELTDELKLLPFAMWPDMTQEQRDKLSQELTRLMREVHRANMAYGEIAGQTCIARRYAIKSRTMIKGTGQAIISRQEFEQGSAAAIQQVEKLKEIAGRMDGQLDMLYRSFMANNDARTLQTFAQLAHKLHINARVAGVFVGRSKANSELMVQADKRLKAAGGQKSFDAYQVQLSANQAVQV